jgi:hypothetical protein
MVTNVPGLIKNSWLARYKKFLIAAATAVVTIANVWTGGPSWLYIVAPVAASILVGWVGNAPMYKDPRK